MTSKPFIELHSEEVQEIMARPPRWLLRWGITVVAVVVSLLLIGSFLFHYPDLVRASFKLTSINPPRAVITRTEGKIIRLLVHDGQNVSAGFAMAYLETIAEHEEVLRLSRELNKAWVIVSRGDLERLNQLKLSNYRKLGELQSAYQTFEQSRIQLQAYLNNGFFSKKKAILLQEIGDLQSLALNLHEQHAIQAQEMKLAQEDYEIQKRLFNEKVIAQLELKREESKNIARKIPYQQTALSLINNLSLQRAKRKEVLELERQVSEERDKFMQALNSLYSATDFWRAKYILSAPVGGRVYYLGSLQENQSVSLNQELFYVAPTSSGFIGELYIKQANAGKVEVGQDVLIKFAGYPYQEFGAVRGSITSIAAIPLKDSVFMAKVTLPTGLTTTYGKSLIYKTGMTATAEVITDDSRLIEKLFYQLRKITNGR